MFSGLLSFGLVSWLVVSIVRVVVAAAGVGCVVLGAWWAALRAARRCFASSTGRRFASP